MKSLENSIDIIDLRVKIDQVNDKIMSNLKDRLRYPLNAKVFSIEFDDGLTWFEYRLKKEQDLDSIFGRYMFYDQQPVLFKKSELAKSKVKAKTSGVKPIYVDYSKKLIKLYKKTLIELCDNKTNDENTFGETTKLDVENIITLNERTVGIGEQVAAYKLSKFPELKGQKSRSKILKKIINKKREDVVIKKMMKTAKKYDIKNLKAIEKFGIELIKITKDAEIYFIQNSKK